MIKRNEKFIIANGCALRISDTEAGDKVVVLLHGYMESLNIWDDFTYMIADKVRVVAIDLPGHGISEVKGEVHTMEFLADVVAAVLEVLEIDKALIVGHSMGGYAALEFVARHPEAAAGIVLMHSVPNGDTEEKKLNRQREMEIIAGGKKDLIAQAFPQVGFAPQNRKRLSDEIEDLAEQIILTEEAGILALLRGMAERRDTNEVLRNSGIAQLAIFGRYDEYIPVEVAEKIAADHPQLKVLWLENSGHMGFIEEPDLVADAVLQLINSMHP